MKANDDQEVSVANIRRRSKSNFARPYMLRFSSLSFLICPSTCPELCDKDNAAWTAA
jgi:hypothetical protein